MGGGVTGGDPSPVRIRHRFREELPVRVQPFRMPESELGEALGRIDALLRRVGRAGSRPLTGP
jgi:hypothetical protein